MPHTAQDETTSLLHDADEVAQYAPPLGLVNDTSPTPLPWRPLIILLALSSVQPLAFELIFPFVNQMILEIGVVDDPEKVGFYSGLIESIFACMSFVTIMPCSYYSNRIGRKPVILIGISGLAVSIALFGLSRSFWFMVVTRCIGGALSGSWASMKIMLAEMTDKSNQGAAFSGLSMSYRMGQILGQPLGGFLSHPERRSSLFQTQFWYDHPFSLPCFVAATFALIAVVMGYFYVEETLASKRTRKLDHPKSVHPSQTIETSGPVATNKKEEDRPSLRSALTSHVLSVLLSLICMVLQTESFFVLYPLFAFTPVNSGGLGVSEATIGAHMAVRSMFNVLVMVMYSRLQRRLGTLRLYQLSMAIWPFSIAFFPTLNHLARKGEQSSLTFNIVLMTFFFIWSLACFSWTGALILVNDSAPSAGALAAINGISQMAIVLPQGIAPASSTSLFALSIESGVAHGNLVWIVLLGFTTAAAVHTLTLKESAHDWRLEYQNRISE